MRGMVKCILHVPDLLVVDIRGLLYDDPPPSRDGKLAIKILVARYTYIPTNTCIRTQTHMHAHTLIHTHIHIYTLTLMSCRAKLDD